MDAWWIMATAEATVVTGAAAEAKVRVTLGTRCCLENSDVVSLHDETKKPPEGGLRIQMVRREGFEPPTY